jgi:dipeptidyl aminopeptidase/acylaminoacyl peptidase
MVRKAVAGLLMGAAALLAAAVVECVRAQTGTKSLPWKPEDVVFSESASTFRISPDGRWAVWVKSVADKEKDARVSNLFLSSLTEKKELQLTRGSDTQSQPRWSPNGQLFAYLSTRALPEKKMEAASTQLWLMSPFGGEPWPVTSLERGIRRFQWVDDNIILFSAEEDPTLYEREKKRAKDDSNIVEDAAHTPPVRLFRFSLSDKKTIRLTENDDWIQNWEASHDGRWVVTVDQRSLHYQWDQKTPPAVFICNLETGERKQILSDSRIRPAFLRWARDDSGFYLTAPYSTHPRFFTATIERLHFYDLASGKLVLIPLDWENGLAGNIGLTTDGFVAELADGAGFRAARYTLIGANPAAPGAAWKRAWLEGDHAGHLSGLELGEDGRTVVYEYSTGSLPPQAYRALLNGARLENPLEITHLNPQWKNKPTAKSEVLRWKGALDEDVDGVLYYPQDYVAGKRYPLVLSIHGGPTGFDRDHWSQNWGSPVNLLTERGAFVLKVNYHGSGNHGLKWVESICCGKYYTLEVPDIEKGVDTLIAQGKVDPDRIGTMGWSNGAILSIQLLVTDPARFKAASVGAADVEWISDWANVDFGQAFDSYYFGKSPLEDPQLYIRKSPFFQLDRVRAPVLIFFGTEDRNVPTAQGWSQYRALQVAGHVPVRFILFPGEPHGPRKLTHQLRKVKEEITWFDRYLFKDEPPVNEAFQENSPLGRALRLHSASHSGNLYGIAFAPAGSSSPTQPVLIPEVVRRGSLEIGRFEVTRAQYAAFDAAHGFQPGTENYPASGITFEQAQAYAAWLSRLTGQSWRIPNEDEVASLNEKPGEENTLDHWAGYALNPDDAARLEEKVKGLPGTAPLLREVGSFAGQGEDGEEPLYDLGGNVSEWVVARNGSGKAWGGSADRPADPRAQYRAAPLAYMGCRIVRGETKGK